MGKEPMPCFDRLLRCFRRTTPLQDQYEAVSRTDDSSEDAASEIQWDTAVERGLGARCGICMDDTRVATHSAVCGHSACELCWASWSSERCMVCQSLLVGGVTRAPFDVVPRTLRECTREPTDTLESAFNKAIAELVEMKQKLKSIVAELRNALKHLQEGAEQGE